MQVKCLRCGNEWDWKGSQEKCWAQCPKCMFMIKIREMPPIPRQKYIIKKVTPLAITQKVEKSDEEELSKQFLIEHKNEDITELNKPIEQPKPIEKCEVCGSTQNLKNVDVITICQICYDREMEKINP